MFIAKAACFVCGTPARDAAIELYQRPWHSAPRERVLKLKNTAKWLVNRLVA